MHILKRTALLALVVILAVIGPSAYAADQSRSLGAIGTIVEFVLDVFGGFGLWGPSELNSSESESGPLVDPWGPPEGLAGTGNTAGEDSGPLVDPWG